MKSNYRKVEELLKVLDRFAMELQMTVKEFSRAIETLRTGEEKVSGNDGVVLGKRKLRPR